MTTCRFFNKKLKREIGDLQDALTDTKLVIFNVINKGNWRILGHIYRDQIL